MRPVWILALFLIGLAVGVSLQRGETIAAESPRLERALEKAGSNRSEIEAVLAHYESLGDTLRLAAARFLIENMDGKSYIVFSLTDSTGAAVAFQARDHADYNRLVAHFDSLESIHGRLEFKKTDEIEDLRVIRSDFLIENIDLAFAAFEERPWARGLGLEDFLSHVLPFRGSNEPLESWRSHFFEASAALATGMEDPSDPIELARRINEHLKGVFRFDPRFYFHPTDQGLREMLQHGRGRCEDMTNIAIYAMRAAGLAAMSDYTPYWGNHGNNHAWNAVLDRDGRPVPFMGCEANPGEYRLPYRAAKIYRKTYEEHPENLAFLLEEGEKAPRWLSSRSYRDVTSDYIPVSDLAIDLEQGAADSVRFAYLCVFNSGEWLAVDWSRISAGRAVFRDAGRGIVYLPSIYRDERIDPAGPPVYLDDEGQTRSLNARTDARCDLRLTAFSNPAFADDPDGVGDPTPRVGVEYTLNVWMGAWKPVASVVAASTELRFEEVPSDGLYWVRARGTRGEERIFTYEGGEPVWR